MGSLASIHSEARQDEKREANRRAAEQRRADRKFWLLLEPEEGAEGLPVEFMTEPLTLMNDLTQAIREFRLNGGACTRIALFVQIWETEPGYPLEGIRIEPITIVGNKPYFEVGDNLDGCLPNMLRQIFKALHPVFSQKR